LIEARSFGHANRSGLCCCGRFSTSRKIQALPDQTSCPIHTEDGLLDPLGYRHLIILCMVSDCSALKSGCVVLPAESPYGEQPLEMTVDSGLRRSRCHPLPFRCSFQARPLTPFVVPLVHMFSSYLPSAFVMLGAAPILQVR
ncbi:hypothetical protein KCU76_g9, partial [Aureobasidium melanogenum]